jgi:hypothetical protein
MIEATMARMTEVIKAAGKVIWKFEKKTEVNFKIIALITKLKRPKVIKLSGKDTNFKIKPTVAFNKAKNKTATIDVKKPVICKPGTTWASNKSTADCITIFNTSPPFSIIVSFII